MVTVDRTLEILKDGEWHSLNAVIEELDLPEEKVKRILQFLTEFGFIVFDEKKERVRVDLEFQKFCGE